MLNLWNSFENNTAEISDKQTSSFRPVDDLWLKMAESMPEQPTGTLAFSQNVVEHLVDAAEQSHTE